MKKITVLLIILLILLLPVHGVALTRGTSVQEKQEDQSTKEIIIENESQISGESATDGKRVEIKQNAYHPAEIKIHPGTTVIWLNRDSVTHTITSGTSEEGNLARFCYPWDELVDEKILLFDSGNLEPGQEYSITFEDPGEFRYFCRLHPDMEGKVIVSE
ncbi:MAG: cupredoxin domain-containing protein [Candidatus Atribacteria bacterium]|nr:cupredoxin domain-containing protein [Candidatus Atribacteria bacterium]